VKALLRIQRATVILLAIGFTPAASLSAQSKTDILWTNLETAVQRTVAGFDGVMAVAIQDLTDGRTISVRGDEVMPTASMIKIAILVELYRQRRMGELYTLDTTDLVPGSAIMSRYTHGVTRLTLRDVATAMIGESDNGATNILINHLGMDRVNAMLSSLGQTRTRLERKMIDDKAVLAGRENVASVNETVALLAAAHHGKLFPPDLTADFFRVLATPKRSRLLSELPPGARGATKTGSLDGVVTEAGILYAPGRPFAIAIMTTYVNDAPKAEQTLGALARTAWDHFVRLGKSSEYGRGLPGR
jgi:beta-lactamase class A